MDLCCCLLHTEPEPDQHTTAQHTTAHHTRKAIQYTAGGDAARALKHAPNKFPWLRAQPGPWGESGTPSVGRAALLSAENRDLRLEPPSSPVPCCFGACCTKYRTMTCASIVHTYMACTGDSRTTNPRAPGKRSQEWLRTCPFCCRSYTSPAWSTAPCRSMLQNTPRRPPGGSTALARSQFRILLPRPAIDSPGSNTPWQWEGASSRELG